MKFDNDSRKRQQRNSGTIQGVSKRISVLKALSLQKGQTALDIGCGGGQLVQVFSLAVDLSGKAYGIDASVSQVQSAQERCKQLVNVEIFCAEPKKLNSQTKTAMQFPPYKF